MRERCEDCRGMEEDIYWTHFHTMHFCVFLSGDFQSQLMIPEKFSEKLGGKLGKKLCLRGPSGTTWDVELVKCGGDLLRFGGGWEVFLEDHSAAENDILVFKYKGNSQFDVLIFEGGSLCERESSYFVRKCGHTKPEQEAETPKISKDCCSVETVQEHSPDPVADSETETETETRDASEKRNSSSKDKGKGLKRACSDQPRFSTAEVELRGKKPSPIWEPVKLPGSKQTPTREARSTPYHYHLYYGANQRSEAEAKELEALKSATRELSEDSFLVAMRSTHVHKKYYLSLPQEWLTKHVTQEKQEVILRTSERSWKTTMIFSSKGRGGLSRGWRDFAADNRLKEFDVCIFKLASQKQKPVVLDVSLFRVGPEVAPPPSLSTPEPSSSRGASAPDKRKFSQLEDDA